MNVATMRFAALTNNNVQGNWSMGYQFAEIAFTPSVRAVQEAMESRAHFARLDDGEEFDNELGPQEAEFIAARDSFYMASVSETAT